MVKRNIAQILVSIDGNTVLSGARKIKTQLITELNKQSLSEQIQVIETGSLGPVNKGVVVGIYPTGEMYGNITEKDIAEFIQERFVKGRAYKKLLLAEKLQPGIDLSDNDSRKTQYYGRIVLDNCGRINPENIEEYIGVGGYEALGIVLKEKAPQEAALRVRSVAWKNPLAINSLGFASLRQELLVTGFFLHSLTGFKGPPFGPVPSYSIRMFEFIAQGRY